MKAWSVFLLAVLTGACGNASSSGVSSHLNEEDARKAFEAASRAVDYLPFGYLEDGCYARAFYMAMEVASEGLPISVQYASGILRPSPTVRWGYHAATMLWREGDEEPLILDPALFEGPIGREIWVDRLDPQGEVLLQYADGSTLTYFGFDRKEGPFAPEDLNQRLEEMGSFSSSDIADACRIMSSYIEYEQDLHRSERNAKQRRLVARTKELVRRLRELGIGPREGSFSSDAESCY